MRRHVIEAYARGDVPVEELFEWRGKELRAVLDTSINTMYKIPGFASDRKVTITIEDNR